jgi:transcriptional regulator with XRE-family HTH domain
MARIVDFGAKMDAELAANPRLNELFQRELTRLKLAEQIASARNGMNLSQHVLAERIGTKQPTVARMERADYTNYNVRTLAKVAAATGHRLDVRLVPLSRARRTGKGPIARGAAARARRRVEA